MPTYTALTIGPIYTTLKKARSTRAIWAASYLFSYIIEKIARHPNIEPHLEGQDTKTDIADLKAGLFPDRLIIKGKTKSQVQTICDEILGEVYVNLRDVEGMNLPELKDHEANPLKSLINIALVEVDLQSGSNVMAYLHHLLDVQELQPFYDNEQEDIIELFLAKLKEVVEEEGKGGTQQSREMLKELFGPGMYPDVASIIEISAREFRRSEIKRIDTFLEKGTGQLPEGFKNYHKYIAVVQADGDSIGATIKAVYGLQTSVTAMEQFAKTLLQNGTQAVEKIAAYGGLPIYAGGDDLLFFAPIINPRSKLGGIYNIFDLLEKLSEDFENRFNKDLFKENSYKLSEQKDDEGNFLKTPTLSFGLSITYFKFPMGEAIERAGNLMFTKAKNVTGKNAVAIKLEKHSGTFFEFNYRLRKEKKGGELAYEDKTYRIFKDLLQQFSDDIDSTSLIYFLYQQKAVLGAIHSMEETEQRETALTNFFENRPGNELKALDQFTSNIVQLLFLQFQKNTYNKEDYREEYPPTIKAVTDLLRTVKFLNQRNDA